MSNMNDEQYVAFLQKLTSRYRANTVNKPVFITDVDRQRVWKQYMKAYDDRQYHNCFACHSFLNRYAGLVTIDDKGKTQSAIWNPDDVPNGDPETTHAVITLAAMAEAAKVTGVFYSDLLTLGEATVGGWRHLSVRNPAMWTVAAPDISTPGQAMAKKREAHTIVMRALREYSGLVISTAWTALKSGKLYRAERVIPQLEWFADVHNTCGGQKPDSNKVWVAVATAPPSMTHVRSGMLGTLLADVAANIPFEDLKKRFNTKMQPGNYQTSQTGPKVGNIAQAEKAVEALGIAPAFERRYTDPLDFADEVMWEPSPISKNLIKEVQEANEGKASVFGHLRPQPAEPGVPGVVVPPRTMTWEKFERDVLPGAAMIEYRVPVVGRFCALTTAADSKAPPILQWDADEARNPVAWCFPTPPAAAQDWSLEPGAMAQVRAIVPSPNLWTRGNPGEHHGKGVFLLLHGAKDVRNLPGGGLFVEHLRSELKPYRSTIEAHLNKLTVQGADKDSTMAFGIGLLAGNDWTEVAAPMPVNPAAKSTAAAPKRVHAILVVDDSASMRGYIEAARAALSSLLTSLRGMPGEVDVTIYKFGSRVPPPLCKNQPISALGDVVKGMDGSSGNTALNDAIGTALYEAVFMRKDADTVYFLGIVTDGEENHSSRYGQGEVRRMIREVLAAGNWTVTFAGAGRNPLQYAQDIGVPEGNATVFSATAEGFADIGRRYSAGAQGLSAGYRAGARATTSFFASATGTRAIGTDYPVLVVTAKSGQKSAYTIDRWE